MLYRTQTMHFETDKGLHREAEAMVVEANPISILRRQPVSLMIETVNFKHSPKACSV
jgi:hypothetical protein